VLTFALRSSVSWMAVDTPARIVVLGAGPTGLETALYARFLGYDVDVFERGGVAENVLGWGHVRMFSPFWMNRSPLGMAAVAAQNRSWQPPPEDALLTGRQWAEAYLLPLAASDLLADHIHTQTRVLAVGRDALLKGDRLGDDERAGLPFRVLTRDSRGQEQVHLADVVIDATGTYGHHNWLGAGGIPAIGERATAECIEYGLPDILGAEREHYAGKRVLLVGAGYSAATNTVALAELADSAPGTQVTWITRHTPHPGNGPIGLIPADRLAQRDQLARRAGELAHATGGPIRYYPGTTVEAVRQGGTKNGWKVQLAGEHAGEFEFDRIIANVGYRPDNSLYGELHVHECYGGGGPMRLAASLLKQPSADCLDQTLASAETLSNPEPDFYILGAKSYGRNSHFLIFVGLEQVRQLFTIIGDRADLDLYASVRPLSS